MRLRKRRKIYNFVDRCSCSPSHEKNIYENTQKRKRNTFSFNTSWHHTLASLTANTINYCKNAAKKYITKWKK